MNQTTITLSEYLSSVKLHQPLTKKRLRTSLVVVFLALISGSLCLYFHLYTPGSGLIGGAIGGVIGYWIQRLIVVRWRYPKIYKQQKSLQEPYDFSWSAEGFSCKGVNASSTTPWANYIRWRENKDVFNLYHSDVIYQIVPKRLFSSESAQEEFRRYLSCVENA